MKHHSIFEDFKADAMIAEGVRNNVYRDSEGYLTVGIGHKLTSREAAEVKVGDMFTDDTVHELFEDDYNRIMTHGVRKHFPDFDNFPHLAKLAVLNFVFQLGTNAPLNFPKATKAINNGHWHRAAMEFKYASIRTKRLSRWYHQTPHRCQQEVDRLEHCAKEASEDNVNTRIVVGKKPAYDYFKSETLPKPDETHLQPRTSE